MSDPRRSSWRRPTIRALDLLCAIGAAVAVGVMFTGRWVMGLQILLLAALVYCIRELVVQDYHAIVRIYGPFGRLRYLFEKEFRDKFLQYFNETNTDGRPIPRIVRNYIYQSAKGIPALASFGTELDGGEPENTTGVHVLHRHFGEAPEPSFEVTVGAARPGVRPFVVTNPLNVSGMSFGSINAKAAECLSRGSAGVAFVNTGEGGYGPHGVAGNDVVFQVGTGKFGVCRLETGPDGRELRLLDDALLADLVKKNDNIHMVQLKLSQGAKPGLGGYLPGGKVTSEIAAVRRIPVGKPVASPDQHAELMASTPRDAIAKLIDLVEHVRELTERPVGIKLCVGQPEELDLLVEAMKETGKGPDDIQIDGADGGTGAGSNLFVNYVGYGNAIETLAYLHHRLKEAGVRDRVTLNASGRIFTPVHAAVAFASGADYVQSARALMLSLGCIQSIKCHTNECPTGIATNTRWRMRGVVVPEKSVRVRNFLVAFREGTLKLCTVLHRADPRDIAPEDLRRFRGTWGHFSVETPERSNLSIS